MRNKAQITLFIILGLVIIIAISFVLYLRSPVIEKTEEITQLPIELQPIKLFIDACIKNTGEEGINLVSKQGGYYLVPENSAYNISYFYYLGISSIPTLETIASEISNYVKEKLPSCLDFKPFEEQGFDIKKGNLTATTMIREKYVVFDVNYPVTTKKGDTTSELNKFKVEVPSSLKKMYGISNEIIEKQEEDPDFIMVSELIEIGDSNNITFTLDEDDYGNVIYSLVDREPIVSEFPELEPEQEYYKFSFAVKYPR